MNIGEVSLRPHLNGDLSGNTDKGMNTESQSKDWYLFTDGVELWAGRPLPPVGEWLEQEGLLCLQSPALQASAHPFDALYYCSGTRLHLVELDGEMMESTTFPCYVRASRMRLLATLDATELIRRFARRCALDVASLGKMPDAVRDYLESGDENLRYPALKLLPESDNWFPTSRTEAVRDAAYYAMQPAPLHGRGSLAIYAAMMAASAHGYSASPTAWSEAWTEARSEALRRYRDWFKDMVDAAFPPMTSTTFRAG